MEKEKKAGKQSSDSSSTNNHVIWDCGSSLYDSFELKAFQKHLDSAISSRTLSMPHLSGRRHPPPPPPPSKISRTFRKLVRAIFMPKSCSRVNNKDDDFGGEFRYNKEGSKENFYMVNDAHSTIPEVQHVSPEIRSQVKRSASERFLAPSWIH